ncbi:MAG: DUF1194 domain-containing protein [SAR324 cluster bacterium]|nr:DUF1194 domain-containing protein [SAR324 cluster bacterium]
MNLPTAEQLRVAELEAAQIQLNIRSLEAQRRSIESTSRQLTEERGALLRSLQEHQGAIVGYLNAAYTLGGGNLVKLVLKQRDPTKIPRMLAYYGYLARARTAALSEARELLNALDAKDQAIEANHTTLLQRKHSLTRAFERLAEAREARASVLSSISLHISMRESDREELSEALVAIERALARVTRERQFDARTFNTARGQIPWPVEKGSITHRFGSRREGEQRWAGLFIAAPEGTEIRAVHPGQVVFSNWLRGLGLLLILDHGGGMFSSFNIPDLDLYYRDCVIGGPGAFIVVAESFQDFGSAIRRKLVLEIAGLAPRDANRKTARARGAGNYRLLGPAVPYVPVVHQTPSAPRFEVPDCRIGERLLQQFRFRQFDDFQ